MQRVLERVIGRPLPALARLAPEAGVELLDGPAQQALVDAAPRDALTVALYRLAVQVAAKEVERRQAGHTPTLDLVLSTNMNRNVAYGRFGDNDTRQASISLELAVPLYQGGLIDSRTREALADRQRAEDELLNAERQALLEAQLGVQSGSALTEALKQALRWAEIQLRSTQRGQQVGVRTRGDVLNAEQQLFATRRDLAAARYRTLVAALQLKAAAGVLREGDLRALDVLGASGPALGVRQVLCTTVAISAINVAKLCAGCLSSSNFDAAKRCAEAERWAGATGSRVALAA